MNRNNTPARVAALLAAATLAACGGSSGTDSSPSGPDSSEPPPSASAEPEAEPSATDDPQETTAPADTEPVESGPDADEEVVEEPEAPAGDRVVTDWQGREITVPAEPARVIALSPTPAMNLALLGFDVIALPVELEESFDERFRSLVPDGTSIDGYEVIGLYDTLNLEELARLEPDVIIGYSRLEELDESAFDVLSDVAPTVLYDAGTNADWRANLDQDAEIVGAEAQAAELEAGYEASLDLLADAGDTSVAFIRSEFGGGGTWRLEGASTSVPGSIMQDAGVNVFEAPGLGEINDTGSFIADISGELLGQLTADVIVVQDLTQFGQDDPLELFSANPLWQTLHAVQNGKVITLPTFVFNGGTYPSAIETIEHGAAAL